MTNPDQISKQDIVQDLTLLRLIVTRKVLLNAQDFGLCPFNEESTPSFHIYLAASGRARYHCFSCEANGDIFNFLKRTNHIDYSLAFKQLVSIIKSGGVSPISSFASRGPEANAKYENKNPNHCFESCQNYLNLKEDYEILLEENHSLRESLNLPDFQPSNETSEPILNFNSKISHQKLNLS